MVYSENLEGNPDVNPGEGETARETARFFCGAHMPRYAARTCSLSISSRPPPLRVMRPVSST